MSRHQSSGHEPDETSNGFFEHHRILGEATQLYLRGELNGEQYDEALFRHATDFRLMAQQHVELEARAGSLVRRYDVPHILASHGLLANLTKHRRLKHKQVELDSP